MFLLMQGLEAQEVCCWAPGGCISLGLPGWGRGIVSSNPNCAFYHGKYLYNHFVLGNLAFQLQVRVGTGAHQIGPADKAILYV